MLPSHLVYNNENLLSIIMSYTNVKDQAILSCVSRPLQKVSSFFNSYWREACNDFFCSKYEQHSLFKEKDYREYETLERFDNYNNNNTDINNFLEWKKNFKLGIAIKQNWKSLCLKKKQFIPNFEQDSEQICEEIYSTLREFLILPQFRKENLHVENELNTIHQKYMYDFLYDQQDIYDHYNEIFEDRKNNNLINNTQINVRRPMLPLSFALENFDDILVEFTDEKDMQSLANIRWYIFNSSSSLDIDSKLGTSNYLSTQILSNNNYNHNNNSANNLNDDLYSIFSTTCSDTFSAKLIHDHQIKNSNHILCLLNSIILSLTYFCKLSINYMNKYQNKEYLYLDCYIKRYKAYVEAAISLNENLENLNVLVNYIYQILYSDYPTNPKFSIYRLMIIIWHREVTTPLCDLKQKNNILSIVLRIFKSYMSTELNKVYGCDLKKNKSKSFPPEKFLNENCLAETEKDEINLEIQSDDGIGYDLNVKSWNSGKFGKTNLYNNYNNCLLNFGLGNNFNHLNENSYYTNIGSKISIFEEIYTFDYQAKYFIELIPSILADSISNEYSTFHINDSQFPISQSYQVFENNLLKIYEKFVKNYFQKTNKFPLITYLKSNDFINTKLFNRTRIKLIEKLSTEILTQCENELTMIFKEYLVSNLFPDNDAYIFLKAFDSTEEKNNLYYENFLMIAKQVLSHDMIAEYATLYFIKEIMKGNNQVYMTIQETREWLESEMDKKSFVDKLVRKENKRRNIILDGDVYRAQLFNFTPNLSFQHILEIYGMDSVVNSLNNKNDTSNVLNHMMIEDMPTFPQTMDIQMQDFDIEIADSDLDLKRR